MITEAILTALFAGANVLFSLLPEFTWTMDTSIWSGAADVLSAIAYLLPWNTVCTVVGLIVALATFRATLAVIRFILRLIPFL